MSAATILVALPSSRSIELTRLLRNFAHVGKGRGDSQIIEIGMNNTLINESSGSQATVA
ncbi:hypothetical protein [Dongshaea marina]|uniref:hypothetical protein n=1 Tax=Dongshaea marina TaxID=2047966 RepID=UPI001F269435|nr:hypothetical protein [Dongshaea marina]